MLACPKPRTTDQGCDASKCCPPGIAGAKNGSGQLPFTRSGETSSQTSPTDARRRPSSVSISCAMPGLQDQRRSAPDLALLPDSVAELQVEASARPSILKSRVRGTGGPESSVQRGSFDSQEDDQEENTALVGKARSVRVVAKQSNV